MDDSSLLCEFATFEKIVPAGKCVPHTCRRSVNNRVWKGAVDGGHVSVLFYRRTVSKPRHLLTRFEQASVAHGTMDSFNADRSRLICDVSATSMVIRGLSRAPRITRAYTSVRRGVFRILPGHYASHFPSCASSTAKYPSQA